MKPPNKQNNGRSVFDVRTAPKQTNLLIRARELFRTTTLDLTPKFYARHPWVMGAATLVIVLALGAGVKRLLVRAEVADFYPASCLGTWQSPEKAQGKPESLTNSTSTAAIDTSNSAQLSGTSGQIFCGSFVPPETDTSGVIKNVGLTLAWNITGLPEKVATSSDVSTETSTATDAATTTTTASTTAATTTTATSAQSLQFRFSPLAWIVPFVHAQETTSSGVGNDASTVIPPTATTTTTVPEPPTSTPPSATTTDTVIASTTLPVATSTQGSANDPSSTPTTPEPASSTPPAPVPVPPPPLPPATPDENFLLLSYSLDGSNWIPLQKVNQENWKNLTLSLPVSQWDDLKKIQIKIEGIPTTLKTSPTVLLDGMFMEAHYDLPPVFSLVDNVNTVGTSTAPTIVQVGQNVTIETPPARAVPYVPPPSIVAINQASGTVSVTVQYVGDFYGDNPPNLFMYPAGTSAQRNGADSAYTFAGEPSEGPSLGPILLGENMFDPSTKQATITIIAPGNGQTENIQNTISTQDMRSGAYAVDISYFDGATWHIIPSQTFQWP